MSKEVQPIRDKNDIERMKKVLMARGYKYYLLFVLGINIGLRISDLLQIRVRDVKGQDYLVLTEQKTNKRQRIPLNRPLQHELDEYIKIMKLKDDDFLIKSQFGENEPIKRIYAYKVLHQAGEQIGLSEVGTHTLRKTFGYWHYKQYKDVALLQQIFNHSSPSITLRYIGISQDEIDKTMEHFFL